MGNWHGWSAVLTCFSSSSSLSCEEETTLALWANVLKTFCLAVITIPVEVLICVGGLPLNCCTEGVVWFNGE